MTHMWLLAKMRQLSRAMYADLDERTWNTFLEELLNRENFNFRREIEGSGEMVRPDWNHCLEYEFQLRRAQTYQGTTLLAPAGIVGCVRGPTRPHEKLDHVFDSRQLAQSVLPGSEGRGRVASQRGGRSSQSALAFSARTAGPEAATRLARQASTEEQRRK